MTILTHKSISLLSSILKWHGYLCFIEIIAVKDLLIEECTDMWVKWQIYFQGSPKCQYSSGLCGFPLQVITEVACGEQTGRQNICRKSGSHQGTWLKGKSIRGERSTSLLLLVCQNIFNGFIGYFSHLRNRLKKGLDCNNFLSLPYKIDLLFSFENFTSDLSITFMPRGFMLSTTTITFFKTD